MDFNAIPPAAPGHPDVFVGDTVLWNHVGNPKDVWTPAIVVKVAREFVSLRLVSNSPYALTTAVEAARFWRDSRNTAKNTKTGVWRHTQRTEEVAACTKAAITLLTELAAPVAAAAVAE